MAQETLSTSLGPFFICQRFGDLCHLVLVIWVSLASPVRSCYVCSPPVVHCYHCCIMLTVGIHKPTPWAVACSSGAGCWILFFCQWVGDGEGEGAYLGVVSCCSGLLAFCLVIPKWNPHIPVLLWLRQELPCSLNFWSTNEVPITCQHAHIWVWAEKVKAR